MEHGAGVTLLTAEVVLLTVFVYAVLATRPGQQVYEESLWDREEVGRRTDAHIHLIGSFCVFRSLNSDAIRCSQTSTAQGCCVR